MCERQVQQGLSSLIIPILFHVRWTVDGDIGRREWEGKGGKNQRWNQNLETNSERKTGFSKYGIWSQNFLKRVN